MAQTAFGGRPQPRMVAAGRHHGRRWEQALTQPDVYLLGRGLPEEERLKRQIADLAPDSDAQLEKIGIRPGEKVVDIGCGPGGVLHLLAKRVGPTGSILGIDRSAHFVEQARRFAADLRLTQVEVREGDAYDIGLPRASFDGAHMRLVLVNVPKPELIVRQVLSLVKPGGWVASFEADVLPDTMDPPSPEFKRLRAAYDAHARSQGIDLRTDRRRLYFTRRSRKRPRARGGKARRRDGTDAFGSLLSAVGPRPGGEN